ncbi:hypothetical protein AK812_SmicGene36965 [Symbiodinium microadriaticum]|uniref:Uncharacterized protein n=1 Tax=Symbiodinium microadriaticum TaxID=2951 RepID=A0A1Q9CHN8_SYMMI|nr:hypothetical protein AK812_SmicGene36965 [Symbiodinium microadriaticum]
MDSDAALEDLPEDLLSRIVVHCPAPTALSFAQAGRGVLAAANTAAQRLFAQMFGPGIPSSLQKAGSGCRGKLFLRLDQGRSQEPRFVQETFAWAAGHGYCSFLACTAARIERTTEPRVLAKLLNGGKEPPLWRAAPGGAPRHPGGECPLSAVLQAPAAEVFLYSEKCSFNRDNERRNGKLNESETDDGICCEEEPEDGDSEGDDAALTAQQKSGDSARRALLAACGTPNAVPYVAVPAPLQMETPLLADKTASINATLPSGKAALHLAAERGDARLVASLLSARAQLDAVTSSGRAALHLAVEHGHVPPFRN